MQWVFWKHSQQFNEIQMNVAFVFLAVLFAFKMGVNCSNLAANYNDAKKFKKFGAFHDSKG